MPDKHQLEALQRLKGLLHDVRVICLPKIEAFAGAHPDCEALVVSRREFHRVMDRIGVVDISLHPNQDDELLLIEHLHLISSQHSASTDPHDFARLINQLTSALDSSLDRSRLTNSDLQGMAEYNAINLSAEYYNRWLKFKRDEEFEPERLEKLEAEFRHHDSHFDCYKAAIKAAPPQCTITSGDVFLLERYRSLVPSYEQVDPFFGMLKSISDFVAAKLAKLPAMATNTGTDATSPA